MDRDLQELGIDCERDLEIAKSLGATMGTFSPRKIKKKNPSRPVTGCRMLRHRRLGYTDFQEAEKHQRNRTEMFFLKLYANAECAVHCFRGGMKGSVTDERFQVASTHF